MSALYDKLKEIAADRDCYSKGSFAYNKLQFALAKIAEGIKEARKRIDNAEPPSKRKGNEGADGIINVFHAMGVADVERELPTLEQLDSLTADKANGGGDGV